MGTHELVIFEIFYPVNNRDQWSVIYSEAVSDYRAFQGELERATWQRNISTIVIFFVLFLESLWRGYFHMYDVSDFRGTQREYSSEPLKYSIVERILVLKR